MSTDRSTRAHCGSCDKYYRITRPSGRPACPACRSPLAVLGGEELAELFEHMKTCRLCGALNPLADQRCRECLTALAPGAVGNPLHSPAQKAVAREDLWRIFRRLQFMESFFLMNAAFAGCLLLSVMLFLTTRASGEVSALQLAWDAASGTAFAALFWWGSRRVFMRPLHWTLVLSSGKTLDLLGTLLVWDLGTTLGLTRVGIGVLWTLALWPQVLPALRLRSLLQEFPELRVTRILTKMETGRAPRHVAGQGRARRGERALRRRPLAPV